MPAQATGSTKLTGAPAMSAPGSVVSRFAPSPTGYLHLGHLVNAIYVWGIVRALGGRVLLRLEDHDRGRCRPVYEAAILEDLEWLGLKPDLGRIEDFRAGPTPYRQTDNSARYAALLTGLASRGLIYTCACSRKTILARTGAQAGELHYDGHCRRWGYHPSAPGGTRLYLEDASFGFEDARLGPMVQCPNAQCGDLLVKDRHGNWTYHFAVVADDWDQGVNLVIRGEDLLESTGRQLQLAGILGRADAPRFLHHPLIADPDGKKLSKRDFARGLREYRAEGRSAESVLGEAAWRVGLLEAKRSLAVEELPGLFEGGRMLQEPRALHGECRLGS